MVIIWMVYIYIYIYIYIYTDAYMKKAAILEFQDIICNIYHI